MKKLYLGGEEIDEDELAPSDFTDFIRALLRDIWRRK
jgi:hypothetical protein